MRAAQSGLTCKTDVRRASYLCREAYGPEDSFMVCANRQRISLTDSDGSTKHDLARHIRRDPGQG